MTNILSGVKNRIVHESEIILHAERCQSVCALCRLQGRHWSTVCPQTWSAHKSFNQLSLILDWRRTSTVLRLKSRLKMAFCTEYSTAVSIARLLLRSWSYGMCSNRSGHLTIWSCCAVNKSAMCLEEWGSTWSLWKNCCLPETAVPLWWNIFKNFFMTSTAFTVNESITEVQSASECAGLSDTSLWDHFIYDNESKTWAGSDETCIKREENSPLHCTDRGIGCCIHGEYIDCPDGVYGCRMGLRGKGKLLLCVWPIHCFITLQALRLAHALMTVLLSTLMAPGVVRITSVITLQIVLDLGLIHICQRSWNLVMALLTVQMVNAMHLAEPVYQVGCDDIHIILVLNGFVAAHELTREPNVGECLCKDDFASRTVSFDCISHDCPLSVAVPCSLGKPVLKVWSILRNTTFN